MRFLYNGGRLESNCKGNHTSLFSALNSQLSILSSPFSTLSSQLVVSSSVLRLSGVRSEGPSARISHTTKVQKILQTTKFGLFVWYEKVLISRQFHVNKCKRALRRLGGKLQTLRELLYVGSSSFRTPWMTVFEFCHIVTLLHPRVILCPPARKNGQG